jgi:hypothetical protein
MPRKVIKKKATKKATKKTKTKSKIPNMMQKNTKPQERFNPLRISIKPSHIRNPPSDAKY